MIKIGLKMSRLSLDRIEINSDQNRVPKERKFEFQTFRMSGTRIQMPKMVSDHMSEHSDHPDALPKSEVGEKVTFRR